MSYCFDFIKKFKKEGNFCGLDKSEVSRLEAYIEILGLLEKHGLDEKFIIEHFTLFAARPLLSAENKDRERGLNYVTACLKRGEKVTTGDLQKTFESWRSPTNSGSRPKKLEISNNREQSKPGLEKEAESEKPTEAPPAPLAATLKEKYGGTERPAPPSPAAQVQEPTDNVVNVDNVEKPPCTLGKPCPEGRNYLIIQKQLGNKCGWSNSLVVNLTTCPIIQREKAAQANGAMFTTAGQIRALDERAPDSLPRAAQNQPMELTIRFSGKQWAVLKQIGREQQLSIEESVLFLVDEAGERMGGS